MRIVFFGTPDYVLPIVKVLPNLAAVVTQSPKGVGRKKFITRSAVDNWAYKHQVPVVYDLNKVPKFDLGILAAYGKIIPELVIRNLKYGILNIHPSLLPKYRGASPIQAAILNGDEETGVTIIKIDKLVDHGPIISQFREEILPTDTSASLRARLFERSAQVLAALIEPYLQGKIKPREQNHKEATYTKIVKKEDGFVDFKKDNPVDIERKLRAYELWPGIWTLVDGKRLKILKAHLDISHQSLVIDTVQLEGKNPVSWEEFRRGYPNARLE
ncbi:methionyl-tRNA formyltransferase [Candidatus Woesebacteria bacterium]|nr:methionyl-tRNA formyltransferase [Candidatus Woesebacteria bacterium]